MEVSGKPFLENECASGEVFLPNECIMQQTKVSKLNQCKHFIDVNLWCPAALT